MIAGGFDAVAWTLVGITMFGALVQIGCLGRYARAPFAPPTWAFAFAYATTATMTLRVIDHEQFSEGDALRWTILAAITGLLATLSVWSVRDPEALLGRPASVLVARDDLGDRHLRARLRVGIDDVGARGAAEPRALRLADEDAGRCDPSSCSTKIFCPS